MTHVTLYAEVIDHNALFGGINNNAMASRNYTVNCLLVIHLSSCISDSHHDYIFLYYLFSLQMSPLFERVQKFGQNILFLTTYCITQCKFTEFSIQTILCVRFTYYFNQLFAKNHGILHFKPL